jgi:hypothetical protein
MDAKLTIKLDKAIIEEAKAYAAAQNRSLSRLIESYLQSLVSTTENIAEIPISPFVRSISAGSKIPKDLDYKNEYREHLLEKHK